LEPIMIVNKTLKSGVVRTLGLNYTRYWEHAIKWPKKQQGKSMIRSLRFYLSPTIQKSDQWNLQ
jgi:hypothetical protein